MKCPNCGLLNPPTAQRCDCGFDFGSQHNNVTTKVSRIWEVSRYLRGLFAWEIAVILPLAIAFIKAGSPVRGEDLKFNLQFLSVVVLYGIPIVAVCSWLASKAIGMKSVLFGFVIGFLFAVLGAFLWASLTSGFEAQPAIFVSCLFLSIPSGVGGGIACWLNRRSRFPLAPVAENRKSFL